MKPPTNSLWVEGNEVRYARQLSMRFASVSANESRGVNAKAPRWTNEHRALHLGLATAFSLQPRHWSFGIAAAGDSQ